MSSSIHYALLGDGRLATHLHTYLEMLKQPTSGWARTTPSSFNTHKHPDAEDRLWATIQPASHVLLLVSDDAIPGVLHRYPFLRSKTLIHCAGARSIPGVAGVHPLMTFGHERYTQKDYENIPFTVEQGHDFRALFPALPNPHFSIAPEQKALYHALCVMAGNFPQVLWRSVAEALRDELGLPGDVLKAYLHRSLENYLGDPDGALTGPLDRGDESTLRRNRAALGPHPLGGVYDAVVALHEARKNDASGRRAS